MSIFDNVSCRDTGMRHIDGIQPVAVACNIEETGKVLDYTTDRNKEWVIELKLRQNFWANDVQRPYIQRTATEALAAMLYQDVLRELPRLRLCIESGDKRGAIEAALRIEQATKP